MTPLVRGLLGRYSPAGAEGRLSIVIFHRVYPEPDPLSPGDPDRRHFDEIVGWLASWFNVLPLDVAVRRLKEGEIPARAACITFDDGYRDNYTEALPILRRHGVTATFFVSTGFLDGGRMWNDTIIEGVRLTAHGNLDLSLLGLGRLPTRTADDKRAAIEKIIPALKHLPPVDRDAAVKAVADRCGVALPVDLMMTSDQVRGLHAAGMQIGAHTVNHPILARCDESVARWEIAESREKLREIIGEPVTLFAYPNGRAGSDYTLEHVRIVGELGFDAAVTTNAGASGVGDNTLQLARFTPWDRSKWRFAWRLASNLRNAGGSGRRTAQSARLPPI